MTVGGLAAGEVNLQKPPEKEITPLPAVLTTADGKAITTAEQWQTRRAELRKQWLDFMGQFPAQKPALKTEVLSTEELPEFTRKHVKYQIAEGEYTDGYLLLPKLQGKRPAMIVFHPTLQTHTARVAGFDASVPDAMHGVQFVKRGYVVWCPRCFIFDDDADFVGNVKKMMAAHPGWTGMARMTWDGIRAADYLETVEQADKERIGAFGHSLGAKETLYAAAFDERIKVGVFSEGGIGLSFSNWEAVWYLGAKIKEPGFALDNQQLLALTAPRAFLVLAGESADTDKSWAYIDAARPVYALLGAPKNIGWFNHRLGHFYPPAAQAVAQDFIDRHLKP